jgi:putative colanic acid biosynthesis acetyltransferase WcaF
MSNESQGTVKLATFRNSATGYHPGAPRLKRMAWHFVNELVLRNRLLPAFGLKPAALCAFGATLGERVRIKWGVNVRFPWNLKVASDVWIGENVWIDSITTITIGSNTCISQGAYLLSGNHDYKSPSFDITPGPITIEDGVWIGAKALVGPGVTCKSHSILCAGSVLFSDMEPYTVYQGNPAVPKRRREVRPQ